MARPIAPAAPQYSLWRMVGYFLWLGTVGFGGPIALAAYMPPTCSVIWWKSASG